jgi:AAA family ATP:ADP antiporter
MKIILSKWDIFQVKNEFLPPLGKCQDRFPLLRAVGLRSVLLSFNFFLIILALYQLKPASRSLFIESLGAAQLPFVWIASALVMGGFIGFYHRWVERCSRLRVVLSSCLVIAGILTAFRAVSSDPGPIGSTCLFIFTDILGVVLVEQFWSLTNSIYTTPEGRGWYGVVGTGGLVGGMAGGWLAALLLRHASLKTPDLLLTAAGIMVLICSLTWCLKWVGMYCEIDQAVHAFNGHGTAGWRIFAHSRYLLMIAALLFLAQLASPLVEYQFMNTVEGIFAQREARTAFLGEFYSVLGVVSVAVNLVATPVVHRAFGPIAGLMIQPLLMGLCSWGFLLTPTLWFCGATRISDRALSYSINRASKELLYVPVDPVVIYQAKAWIDMFGYRIFKLAGSVLILLFTQWLPIHLAVAQLSWFTIGICIVWIGVIVAVRHQYQTVRQAGR